MVNKFKKIEGRLICKNIVSQCKNLHIGESLVLFGNIDKDAILIKRRENDFQMIIFCNDGWNVDYPILSNSNYGKYWKYDNPYLISQKILQKMDSINIIKAYKYCKEMI